MGSRNRFQRIIERFELAKQEAAQCVLLGCPRDVGEFITRIEIFAPEILEDAAG